MGNAATKFTAYGKLAAQLPAVKNMGHDESWNWVDKSMKVFADDKDREQFIHAVLAIVTANGAVDLSDADYKLFYARRPSSVGAKSADDDILVAIIAASREGRIVAKIEPEAGGADQREAFLALKKDVECKLGVVLESVPSASFADAGSSSAPLASDMPPSYQSSAVGVMGREKA